MKDESTIQQETVSADSTDELAQELARREQVLEILRTRKDSADDRTRGRLDRLIEMITRGDAGWTDQQIVRGILRDIKQAETRQKKAQQARDAEMDIDDLVKLYNFHVKASGSAVWYYQNLEPNVYGVRDWVGVRRDALVAAFPQLDTVVRMGDGLEDFNVLKEFNKKLVKAGRRFSKIIQSYHNQTNALNIMHQGFCMPADDGAEDYHWIFDAVLESLSGGAPGTEEFQALQRTIWAKYLHPENIYIPHIVICDVLGRGGKGLTSNTFLRRLFNGKIADNCNIDHIIGKFNAVVAGKALIVVNETNRSRVDSERTKAFLGSPSIPVELKGQDVYYADNTALVIFVTNDINGGVNVGGTLSDNRFSFFRVNQNIYQVCQRYMRERESREMTELEIKQWIEGRGQDAGQVILHDEYEVGRWINAQAAGLGDVTHVEPVHAAEYQRIVDKQRGAWTHTVDSVFEDPAFEYIRFQLLYDMIRYYNRGEMLPGKNRMRDEVERLIRDRGYNIELCDRAHIRTATSQIQRTVWRRQGLGVCTGDESRYGQLNNRDIWEWHWVI
jgi:hypothetical protein